MKQIITIGYLVVLTLGLTVTYGCASPKAGKGHQEPLKTGNSVKYAKGVSRLGFAIQMGAFSDVKNAERFANRLQDKGLEAFYYRKDNGIYAVRFGDFPSKEKARSVANRLVADKLIDSFYIAPPNEVVFANAKEPSIKQNRPELHKPLKPYPPPTNELGLPDDESPPAKPAAKPPDRKSVV